MSTADTTGPATTVDITVDADNRIIQIGGLWDAMARAGGADCLDANHVLGHHLFDFISGDSTRMYVDVMLQSVRLQHRELVRPYRCDSPEQQRFMEMVLTPLPQAGVQMSHRLLRVVPLARPLRFATTSARTLNLRCSNCNALRIGQGVWLSPADTRQDGLHGDRVIQVAYAICPHCQ